MARQEKRKAHKDYESTHEAAVDEVDSLIGDMPE